MNSISHASISLFNQNLRYEEPLEIIEFALELASKPMITTSFGPYSAALLHAVTRCKPDIEVVWCDSGYNTAATYSHAQRLIRELDLKIRVFSPEYTTAYINQMVGKPDINNPHHGRFSEIVKLKPFRKAIEAIKPDVWFTNLRKGQTKHRDALDILSLSPDGILKVSPFHYFNDQKISEYLTKNNLPVEHDYFDPVKAMEHRECGIHL